MIRTLCCLRSEGWRSWPSICLSSAPLTKVFVQPLLSLQGKMESRRKERKSSPVESTHQRATACSSEDWRRFQLLGEIAALSSSSPSSTAEIVEAARRLLSPIHLSLLFYTHSVILSIRLAPGLCRSMVLSPA